MINLRGGAFHGESGQAARIMSEKEKNKEASIEEMGLQCTIRTKRFKV